MMLEETYKRKNLEMQNKIKRELENIRKGISKKDDIQLSRILAELEKSLDNKCLPLSYPRVIIDSWNYDDRLGAELLKLSELYKRWM